MSNSVVFLLIAVGLSVLGATAVWLHGRPRRNPRHTDDFGATLRALSESQRARGHQARRPSHGATDRTDAGTATPPAMSPRDPRRARGPRPGA